MNIRHYIDLAESLQGLSLFHGSCSLSEPAVMKPYSHFGTLKAACMRISDKMAQDDEIEEGYAYGFRISISNPLMIDDGEEHVNHTLAVILGSMQRQGIITDEQRSAINGGRTLRETLTSLGFDGLVYKNMVEDAGSLSYMILTSDQAVWDGSREEFTREDAIDRGWL